MTPTLSGRIQSRLFLLATVGLVWTLALTPLLPRGFAPLGVAHTGTLSALVLVALLGTLLWEPLYHLLQQFRWEKDWPAIIILFQGVPEGVLVYLVLLHRLELPVQPGAFAVRFSTTWLLVFVFLHGPLRVPFLRWRFRGGRSI
ncbi:hypothetical protein BJF83_11530 [Nocardiopsis sp. CNR-923]|uniref:hypothetical protein n=1 Tax=Nocardiopsis sp. CNR-923 TaxID=1904965 RepID=UPI000962745F|nr:hypothetical protein [Nocardiopsis sp. CNR-923]OLT29423.1 hypothetical protein BJF83_11530 [Nocardiopsis sp. CNR-923]